MPFLINTRIVRGVVVVDMSGPLSGAKPVAELRRVMDRFRNEGRNRFVLNFLGVSTIDSFAIGTLVEIHTSLQKAKSGGVCLMHVNAKVKYLLKITKLSTVFKFFDDEQEAVRSFPKQPDKTNG